MSKDKSPIGYVYFIRQKDKDIFKIGRTTKNPWKRMVSLQHASPEPLEVFGYIRTPAYWVLEKYLHEFLDSHKLKIRGEWFDVNNSIVNHLIDTHYRFYRPCPYIKVKLINLNNYLWYLLYCNAEEVYVDRYSFQIHHGFRKTKSVILSDRMVIPWTRLNEFQISRFSDEVKQQILNIVKNKVEEFYHPYFFVQSLDGNNKTLVKFFASELDDADRETFSKMFAKWGINNVIFDDNIAEFTLTWPENAKQIRTIEYMADFSANKIPQNISLKMFTEDDRIYVEA